MTEDDVRDISGFEGGYENEERSYSTELKRQRERDFMAAYRNVAMRCSTNIEAYRLAIKQPAPRFYVTAEQARHHVRLYAQPAGRASRKISRDCTLRMYDEITRRYNEYMESGKGRFMTTLQVLNKILSEPAPEFYITLSTAQSYFLNAKKMKKWIME